MSHYRCYLLDSAGDIQSGESGIYRNDEAAIESFLAMYPGERLEIWEGTRLVASRAYSPPVSYPF